MRSSTSARIARRAILFTAALSAIPTSTQAASGSSWTFNGNGNWNTASNWFGGVPVAGSDVFITHANAINHTVTYDYGGP